MVGGWWQLVAVGFSWRLAIGGWWGLAVGGKRLVAVSSDWWWAVGGGWQFAIGGPWGLNEKKISGLLEDSPGRRSNPDRRISS